MSALQAACASEMSLSILNFDARSARSWRASTLSSPPPEAATAATTMRRITAAIPAITSQRFVLAPVGGAPSSVDEATYGGGGAGARGPAGVVPKPGEAGQAVVVGGNIVVGSGAGTESPRLVGSAV